ncbi:MAG TPA: hypothetical protein VL120_11830 [Solirubrobacteraceae bacterium]|jgi:hypothetical protein|nr:hypothetical protein [Solirubrobacteraceae bacterium]
MKTQLVTAARSIARDLVAKRLWPVAVLLLVALVAVPIVIGSSDATVPPTPAASLEPPAAAGDTAGALTIAAPAVIGHARPGAVHDPFFAPPKPEKSSSPEQTTATAPTTTVPSTTAPATTTTTTTNKPTTTTPAAPATTPIAPTTSGDDTTAQRTVYRTRARWGADDTADVRGLSRLQALGGTSNPAVMYLGTTSGGRRAVFLLGPSALATGDGKCAESRCRVFVMSPGDKSTVGVLSADGSWRKFTLVIDKIVPQVSATVAEARALRARVDADGRSVLREMIKDPHTAAAIGLFAYDRATGAVVATDAP